MLVYVTGNTEILESHTQTYIKETFAHLNTQRLYVGALFLPVDCVCTAELIFQPPHIGRGVDSPSWLHNCTSFWVMAAHLPEVLIIGGPMDLNIYFYITFVFLLCT